MNHQLTSSPNSPNSPWGTPLKVSKPLPWRIGDKFYGGMRPLLMGIINVTPDSFFDGGKYNTFDTALKQSEKLIIEGANILDVGGESTRPGSKGVNKNEELKRVADIIKGISKRFDIPISIDTTKSFVANAAIEEGASIINDVTAMTADAHMPQVAQNTGASVVLNHIQGVPSTMQKKPQYGDVVKEIKSYLNVRVNHLTSLGIPKEKIAVDPGIGFGKQLHHNYQLIARSEEFKDLHCPLLLGMSRKSFIGNTEGLKTSDRLQPSVGAAMLAALKGVSILRVHDVNETKEQLFMIEAILSKGLE